MVIDVAENRPDDLSPSDIRRIREGLGLTQVEAGELLGGGPRAFAKYENGAIKPAASIMNLLLLLENAPHELQLLTGAKAPPLESPTHNPFEVTANHVQVLTPTKLVLLVERLLAAEAMSAGLPMDGIHVAAKITVSDGGEDARIEWIGGPDRTPFVPSRLTQFQLKATHVTPAAAKREVLTANGEVQPMVREALANAGSYVMLVTKSKVKKTMVRHEDAVRKILIEKGLCFEPKQIVVRDASQIALWVNAHPPVASWLLRQTQPGLIGPFRDWSHWAGRHEHESSPWVDDPRLEPFRTKLRELVAVPRGVARVIGPSGIGKSRLTLEALAPDATEETSYLALSAVVLYALESESGTTTVKAAVQTLADASVRAVVVVDRCDPQTHDDLVGMARRLDSQLSLVTIDHEFEPAGPRPGTLMVEKADRRVVLGIVRNVLQGLHQGEQERLASFAAGHPRAARLLADSWDGSSIAFDNDALIDRVLLGRRPVENDLPLRAGMLLSVFGLVGARVPLDTDIQHLAALPGAPTADELRRSFEDLLRRGIAQSRGRLLSLQPLPIRLPLAQRQWRQWNDEAWDIVLATLPVAELRVRAARQLAILNREEIAHDVARSVCRLGGPFGTAQQLKEPAAAAVLSSLAEVDAQATVDLIEHVLDPLDHDQLQQINGETRRHLVGALEKIAFREDTFEQAARLLLALACAENEQWDNNATGNFKSLFSVLGGSTSAGPEVRLRLLGDLIGSGDEQSLPLVAEALLSATDLHSGVRMVGAELHGSRPALSPWLPANWKDAGHYVKECSMHLARLAVRDDVIGARARAGLGSRFRTLVRKGLLQDTEHALYFVVSESGCYWPEALVSLGHLLVYDSDSLEPRDVVRVRALIDRLTPTDMADRVKSLVTEMPWDYPVAERLEFDERERRQLADVDALAVELLKSPQELQRHIPNLSRGHHRMSTAFGRAIAKNADHPLEWLTPITTAYASAPPEEADEGLLGGFMGTLALRHPKAVESFKSDAVRSPVFAPAIPFVCSCAGLVGSDLEIAKDALASGLLPPSKLLAWRIGSALSKLSCEAVAPLFDNLLNGSGDAYTTAIELIGSYVHGDFSRLDRLRPQLRLAADKAGQRQKAPGFQLDQYHFQELMKWILDRGRQDPDAAAIALSLAKQVVAASEDLDDQLIKPLLPQLLRDYPEIAWPIIGQAIVSDRSEAWRLELWLGDSFTFDDKRPAILDLPEEALFAWCHAHPDVAPAFVAGLLPVLTSRDPDDESRALHPWIMRILDEFGDQEAVLSSLSRNMYTFGWCGSRATYYALYDRPLRSLETHEHGTLRRWAKRTRLQLRREVDSAHIEEDEREAGWEI